MDWNPTNGTFEEKTKSTKFFVTAYMEGLLLLYHDKCMSLVRSLFLPRKERTLLW